MKLLNCDICSKFNKISVKFLKKNICENCLDQIVKESTKSKIHEKIEYLIKNKNKMVTNNFKPEDEKLDWKLLRKAKYKNKFRDQIVEVTEFDSKNVTYYWKDCEIGKFYYQKSVEHFLRSYTQI